MTNQRIAVLYTLDAVSDFLETCEFLGYTVTGVSKVAYGYQCRYEVA